MIWSPPSWYANEVDMTSQLQDWKLRKYHFAYKLWLIEGNCIGKATNLGINPFQFLKNTSTSFYIFKCWHRDCNAIYFLYCRSPVKIHHNMFEIESSCAIISALKLEGLCCFFGCNNAVCSFWLRFKSSIIAENVKRVCSWSSGL